MKFILSRVGLVLGVQLASSCAISDGGSNEGGSSSEELDASPFDVEQTTRALETVTSLRETFGDSFLPEVAADAPGSATATAEVVKRGNSGGFSLRDKASGVAVDVQLLGSQSTPAEGTAGYAIRRGALGKGFDLIQRSLPDGIEDLVYFPTAPEEPRLQYSITLEDGAVGLRQIDNALELLDQEGAPRLRITTPYLLDAKKRRVELALHVDDCQVDRNPAAPWGRPVVDPGADRCTLRFTWPEDTLYPALVDPTWVTTANTAVPRYGHTLTKLQNGRVLVVGGIGAYIEIPVPPGWEESGIAVPGVPEVEIYDPTSQTWSFTAPALRRHSHIAERLNNGEVLIAAGLDGTEHPNFNSSIIRYVGSAQRYNPTTGTWTTATPLLSGFRARAASVLLNDGTVLISGGQHGENSGLSAETYDPTNDLWVATGALNRARARHEAVKLADGRVLLVGGDNEAGAASEIYNPLTRTFGTVRALTASFGPPPSTNDLGNPLSQALTVTGLLNGEILAVAHRASVYDPAAHSWREVGAPLLARGSHTAQLLPDGNVLIFGGKELKPDDTHLTAEIFRPGQYGGLWAPVDAGGHPRHGLRSVSLDDGKILTQGGWITSGTRSELYEHIPDPAVSVADYLLPTGNTHDPGSLSEYRARLYRPTTLTPGKKYPLALVLHGRGPACIDAAGEFFLLWDPELFSCPPGSTIRELHKGFGYLAEELARQGFFVVSINWLSVSASDPNGSPIMPIAGAGRSHLQLLQSWNSGASATPPSLGIDLFDRIDFTRVGVIGHSNGGTAASLLAGSLGMSFPITFRGVVALAPVEGGEPNQSDRPPIAGLNWVGLLPSCDRDGGIRANAAFNRRARVGGSSTSFAATHLVPGANHNFYNTELNFDEKWGIPINPRCGNHAPLFAPGATSSAAQLQTGLRAVLSLFLGKVRPLPNPLWTRTFEPRRHFPSHPQFETGYLDSSLSLENFNQATGTSHYGFPTATTGAVTVTHYYPLGISSFEPDGKITWTGAGTWRTHFRASGSGLNLSQYTWLDISLARTNSSLNAAALTDFSVALVRPDGSLSSQLGLGALRLTTPGGLTASEPEAHVHKRTYRVPLSNFSVPLTSIRGVQLRFGSPSTLTGEIRIAHIRASRAHE